MHSYKMRMTARKLRRAGRTHREIAKELKIGIGSAHLWTRDIDLSVRQRGMLFKRLAVKNFTSDRRKQLSSWAKIALAKYREKYTKSSLIAKIIDFHKKEGRIPLKREFNMHDQFLRHFKSWNDAIRTAGFNPNPVLFAKKFVAKDGHRCDSFSEKIIDEWLIDNRIPHSRNFRYAQTKLTADFLIDSNIILEFFGLVGVQKSYDTIVKQKFSLAKKLNLKLIAIYPNDLFPLNRLGELLKSLPKKEGTCGLSL